MENAEVAKSFAELADLMELTGGNPYKARAYRQAAQVIDTLPGPVSELWRRGELTTIPSIGERIAERIGHLLETGTLADRDELASRVPPAVLELLAVEGVGPKMGVALEVNAMPERLDLTDRACRLAKEAGVRVAISTDAHVAAHLRNVRNGVWVARRGWLEPKDVINTRPLEELWALRQRH